MTLVPYYNKKLKKYIKFIFIVIIFNIFGRQTEASLHIQIKINSNRTLYIEKISAIIKTYRLYYDLYGQIIR